MSIFNRRVFNVHAVCAFVAGLVGFKLKPAAAQQEAVSIPFKSLPTDIMIFGNPRNTLTLGFRQEAVDATTDCFHAYVYFKQRAQSVPLRTPEVLLSMNLQTRDDYMLVNQRLHELANDYSPAMLGLEPTHRDALIRFAEALNAFGKIVGQTSPARDMSKVIEITRTFFRYDRPVTVLGRLQPV